MIREKKALKCILIFFAAMLVLTVVSRAADSVTIPKVKTETMKKGTLHYSVNGEGEVTADEEQLIFLAPGGRPSYTVPVGTAVAEGDILVRFDMEALSEKLKNMEAELKKLEIAREQEILGGQPQAQADEQDAAARSLSQIEAQLENVRAKLQKKQDEYNTKSAEGAEEEELQKLEEEIQVEEDALKSLEQSLQQAQNVLDDAKVNDANTARNNKRQQEMADLAKQSIQLDIEEKQQEMDKIRELIGADGNVTADLAGVITEITAVLGVETSGQEYCKIGTGNGKLKAVMEKEDAEKLNVQDKIEASATGFTSGGKQKISGTIEGIQDDEDGKVLVTAALEANEFPVGTKLTFSSERESGEYDAVVPISAVREDSQGKYVLIIREESTILGKEKQAARVDVKILEKNDRSAAVDSALLAGDEIIVDSSKSIKAGDRIRIE